MIFVLIKTIPFFAIMLFGFAARRWNLIDGGGVRGIARFVMFLALPALLFGKLAGTSAEIILSGRFLLAYASAAFLAFGISAYAGRLLFRCDLSQSALFGLAGAYGNIGFLGIPLLSAIIGDWVAIPLALVLTIDLALLVPLASVVMKLGRTRGMNKSGLASALFSAIIRNPLVIAIVAGVLFSLAGIQLPGPVDKLSLILSQAAAPCAMFVVGAALAAGKSVSRPIEAVYMSVFKLAVYPVLVWGMLTLAGVAGNWRAAATLGAAMPAAAVLSVIAEEYGVRSDQASMAILISTVLSLFTISLVLTVIWA